MAKKKGRFRFLKGMIIYVLLFALIAAAALMFLYKYMEVYEVSGSKGCLRGYMAQLDEGVLPESLEQELDKLDESVRSREDSTKWLQELVSEAGYARVPGESSENSESYSIISRGAKIGKLRIETTGEEKYGMKMWAVAEEEYSVDDLLSSRSYYLPEDYSLCVGDAVIEAGKDKKEYEVLDYVYERYEDMPCVHKFESGMYLGDVEVKVLDARGNEIGEEQFTEQYFLNNCDEELHKRLEDFGKLFVQRYVDYGAVKGGQDNFFVNYIALKEVMLHEGELYKRIESGWGTLFYANTRYCNILDLNVNICSQLADNLYLIDVSYETETKGYGDAVVSDNYVRIVAIENDKGNLVATNLYNY